MKNVLAAILILGLAVAMPIMARADSTPPDADVVITTGGEGGNYHGRFGRNLAGVLGDRDWDVALWPSEGSLDNLRRIDAGDADLGFTQGDALSYYLKENASSSTDPLAALGQECFFVAVGDDSDIDDSRDLNNENYTVGVGDTKGGTYASWLNLQTLEPYLKKPRTMYRNGPRALAKLLVGDYDAVAWVTSSDGLSHENFEIVLQEDSGFRLISVNDWDFDDSLPNGEPVYTLKEITIRENLISDDTVTVPCMDMYVVGNTEGDEDLLDDVAIEAMMNRSRLMAE